MGKSISACHGVCFGACEERLAARRCSGIRLRSSSVVKARCRLVRRRVFTSRLYESFRLESSRSRELDERLMDRG